MAEFDESKVIDCLHTDKAEIGKKYYFNDSLYLLKGVIEGITNTENVGVLACVYDGASPFEKSGGAYYEFIYPYEEPKKKRMTNRHLSEWLAKGNGQISMLHWDNAYMTHDYEKVAANEEVPADYIIRPWDSDIWIEPTVDIYLRDCK